MLLDNFPVWQTQIAVAAPRRPRARSELESSGGLSLDTAADYAGTGVDYLAVGALTHSVRVAGYRAGPLGRAATVSAPPPWRH